MNWGSEIRDSQSFDTDLNRPRDLAGRRWSMQVMISGGSPVVVSDDIATTFNGNEDRK